MNAVIKRDAVSQLHVCRRLLHNKFTCDKLFTDQCWKILSLNYG